MMKTRRILIAMLAAALLVSVGLNVALFREGRRFYTQLNETRLDPLGLNAMPADEIREPASEAPQKRLVFFGDSRAYDWPGSPGLDGFQVVNRGMISQTSAQVLARFDEHVTPWRPDVVVVQVGINDLKAIPLFPDRKAAIIAGCEANIEQIVSRAVDLGATVVLTSIFPHGAVPLGRRPFWSSGVAEAIETVNVFLVGLEGEKVLVLDSTAILADEKGRLREEYSVDLLHLNPAGYEVLNKELLWVLATLMP
jgi:lysophospholipase L1-like esterase